MASTAKAGTVIGQIRSMNTQLIDLQNKLTAVLARYTGNGGQTFLHPYFLDENEQPRADLDVTEAQIITSVANMQTILASLETYLNTFVQAE